jgi:hypothetical protein
LVLEQPLLPQAVLPCPSKSPVPDTVKWSIRAKLIQLSPVKYLGSPGECILPRTLNSMGPLQGPRKITVPTLYVAAGTTTLLEPGYAHASFQALVTA